MPVSSCSDADRKVHGDALGRQLLLELRQRAEEVGALAVEHVDEDDARETELVRDASRRAPVPTSTPMTPLTTTSAPSTTRRAHRDLALEAGVSGNVEQVDLPALPLGVRERQRDRHLPLVLVLVPVADGRAGLDRPRAG